MLRAHTLALAAALLSLVGCSSSDPGDELGDTADAEMGVTATQGNPRTATCKVHEHVWARDLKERMDGYPCESGLRTDGETRYKCDLGLVATTATATYRKVKFIGGTKGYVVDKMTVTVDNGLRHTQPKNDVEVFEGCYGCDRGSTLYHTPDNLVSGRTYTFRLKKKIPLPARDSFNEDLLRTEYWTSDLDVVTHYAVAHESDPSRTCVIRFPMVDHTDPG